MPAAWRAAGLSYVRPITPFSSVSPLFPHSNKNSYLQYVTISSRCIRNVVKDEFKLVASRRNEVGAKVAMWENGKMQETVCIPLCALSSLLCGHSFPLPRRVSFRVYLFQISSFSFKTSQLTQQRDTWSPKRKRNKTFYSSFYPPFCFILSNTTGRILNACASKEQLT